MATMTVKTDDIDGTPATGSVQFTVGGVNYKLDLNDANQAAFAADVAKWIEHAPQPSATSTGSNRSSGGSGLGMLNGRYIGKAEVRRFVEKRGADELVKQYPELEGKLPLGPHYVPPALAAIYAAEMTAQATAEGRPVPTEPPAAQEAQAETPKPETAKPAPKPQAPAAARTRKTANAKQ